MDNIAEDLGISKKTLYKYFENKDHLVEETLKAYLADVKITQSGLNENAIEEFCHTINGAIQKLVLLPQVFFNDLKKYHFGAHQFWQEYKQKHILDLFEANLLRGIQSGLYRPDLNPLVAARLYFGQLQAIYYSDLFPPDEFNLQEIYRQNLKHFMLSIVSANALKNLP